jgi:RND family efflux transporter MFP subunit
MKKIINTLFTLSMLAGATMIIQACTDTKGEGKTIPKSTEAIPVKVIALQKSAGTNAVKASGQITTDDETTLAFKTGGIVSAVYVKEGDQVRRGQLLATLDLTEIKAQVAQAKLGHEKAARDFQRVTNLYKDSVATLEQLQNAETGLAIAKEQLQAAQFNQSFSEIHAPANGYVLRKFVNAGQVVGTGDPIVMTNGAQSGNWILKVGVSDKQWAAVSNGSKATVALDAFPGKVFEGKVLRKSESSDAQTGAFAIEISVKAQGEKLARGMFGAVEIETGQQQLSWNVPYEAVLDANDNEGFVFVTNDNKTAVKQPVMIESFDGKSIRISKGLEDAQALIVSGSAYLSDKSPITIVK